MVGILGVLAAICSGLPESAMPLPQIRPRPFAPSLESVPIQALAAVVRGLADTGFSQRFELECSNVLHSEARTDVPSFNCHICHRDCLGVFMSVP